MGVVDKLTAIASILRNRYDTKGLLSLDQMAQGIDNLEVKNLINPDQVSGEVSPQQIIQLQKLNLEWANQNLRGKNIILSFDLEVTDYSADSSRRAGFEYSFMHKNGSAEYAGAWIDSSNLKNGKYHVTNQWYIDSSEITEIGEGCLYFQLNAKGKASNFKMFVNPMV